MVRVFYIALLAGLAYLALHPSPWEWTHAVNWVNFGYALNGFVNFERAEHYERQRKLEALMPWFDLVVHLKWILAVTKNVPGYLQLRCLQQEVKRRSAPQIPRGVMMVVEHFIASLEDP